MIRYNGNFLTGKTVDQAAFAIIAAAINANMRFRLSSFGDHYVEFAAKLAIFYDVEMLNLDVSTVNQLYFSE
jgi:hypothetical protein